MDTNYDFRKYLQVLVTYTVSYVSNFTINRGLLLSSVPGSAFFCNSMVFKVIVNVTFFNLSQTLQ